MSADTSEPMLRFVVTSASWSADGEEFATGDHEIAKPSAKLIRLASHAHAAGAISVSDGLDLSTVESQGATEKAYAEAQGEHVVERLSDGTSRSYWTGPWHEGNLLACEASYRGMLADENLPDSVRTLVEHHLEIAQRSLDEHYARQEKK